MCLKKTKPYRNRLLYEQQNESIPVCLYCFCFKDQDGDYLGDSFADPVLIRGCIRWPSEGEVPPSLCYSVTLFFCPILLTLWDSCIEYMGNCINRRVFFLLKRPLHFACDKNRCKFCFSSSYQGHNIWRGSPSPHPTPSGGQGKWGKLYC